MRCALASVVRRQSQVSHALSRSHKSARRSGSSSIHGQCGLETLAILAGQRRSTTAFQMAIMCCIIKYSTVLIFRPAGMKRDDIAPPSLTAQPNTITEAGLFNCIIESIAGDDSCVLTVLHPKHHSKPLLNFMQNQPGST